MKLKATQKRVKEVYRHIICIGYCNLQYLLYYRNAFAYTAGVYGWNADIYDIGGGVAICTGYRPFGNVSADYELVNEYDNKAREIIHNTKIDDNPREKVDELLNEFIEKVLGE